MFVAGHGDRAGAVAPDGRSFALADDKGRVRLLDLETGSARRFEGAHEDGRDLRMTFAPDGRTLVSSDARGEVIVWDVQKGRIRERLIGHTEWVNGLAISPDGRTLYTAGIDAKLTLWDLPATGGWTGASRPGHRWTSTTAPPRAWR